MPELERRASLLTVVMATLLFAFAGIATAAPTVIYDSVPNPLPPNLPSLGFQANHTSEFGDLIQFSGTNRTLANVTVAMSDWAIASDYGSSSPTWNHPITLNLYNVDNSGANPAPGSLIATRTQTFAIPWRPPADPTCSNTSQWKASDGNCYSGLAFTIIFDFSGTVVPDQIIYGVVYNTETFGPSPIGAPGPYISLNLALTSASSTVGSNPLPDTAYWNTNVASNYADGGAGGTGTFRQDTNWTPFSGAVTFVAADADLAVTKTGPPMITAGSNMTYIVTVTNNGPSDAQSLTLTDALPAGTTFVSETQNSGPSWVCANPTPGAGGTVSCMIATLASGASAAFTLVFNVNAGIASGTIINNTATAASTTSDSTAANNSATSSATVVSAVPALGSLALMLLGFALAAIAFIALRS